MKNLALRDELGQLETETFEIHDIAEIGEDLGATSTTSSACSTTSTCSCSCSSCCGCTSCSCGSTSSCA